MTKFGLLGFQPCLLRLRKNLSSFPCLTGRLEGSEAWLSDTSKTVDLEGETEDREDGDDETGSREEALAIRRQIS